MRKIKVDVLIVGSAHAESYISCADPGNIIGLGNVKIGENEFPTEIRVGETVFDVSEAIFVRANNTGVINIKSLLVPKGKIVAATGDAMANVK